MKAVRPAFRDDVHHRAGRAAVLGRKLIRDEAYFLDDIRIVDGLRRAGDARQLGLCVVPRPVAHDAGHAEIQSGQASLDDQAAVMRGLRLAKAHAALLIACADIGGEWSLDHVTSALTRFADASVAAGPVGREASAQTDAKMHAEILSWSRARGVFAGISLQGATLRQDLDDNAVMYGKKLTNKEIVETGVATPKAAQPLISLLSKYSSAKTK